MMEVSYVDLEGNIFYENADRIIFGMGFLGDKCQFVNSDGVTVAEVDTGALLEVKVMP